MRQYSFSEAGFEKYRKKTRKEQFLEEMDSIIPWGTVNILSHFFLGGSPVPGHATEWMAS